MPHEIQLPELGENIDTAVVGGVLVSPGDTIEKDQPLIEVETDKATAEVPSPVAGVVKAIRVSSGDEIKVGQVIVVVEESGEAKEEAAEPEPEPEPEPKQESKPEPEPKPEPKPEPPPREPSRVVSEEASSIPAAPAVRRLARELGVDLSTLRGTGPGGRISLEDVKGHAREVVSGERRPAPARGAAPAAAPKLPDFTAWGKIRRETMTGIERKTAEAMALSGSLIPQVTQFDRADVTELEAWRRRFASRAGKDDPKLTVTAIVLKVAAAALRKFPRLNASLDVEAGEIVYKESVHLGVAVDAPQGLLVPVIRDADTKGVLALAKELADLSARAKAKKLSVEEMRGATFTITNLGGLGTLHFSPIVNWPEAAILGIGRATPTVVEKDGAFATRTILPLSLSYDHRLINGADAARFERWIAEALEQPLTLVLEG